MISKIKKNLIKVVCNNCKTEKTIFKYSKKQMSCDSCTSTLAHPGPHKCFLKQGISQWV